jgi:mannose-6-phosphate isomerase-like protein (cupin superfamily)
MSFDAPDPARTGTYAVRMAPGSSIPPYDEAERDRNEVFITLQGEPTIVLDGREIPLPTGRFARVAPPVDRTIVNRGRHEAVVLIASAPRSRGEHTPADG